MCAMGIILVLFILTLLRVFNADVRSDRLLGISFPDKKTVKLVLISLPATLIALGAITWHWKYTLEKLDIPFEQTQALLQYADISKPEIFWLLILMAVIIIPVTEELVFRRAIFELIAKGAGFNAAGFLTAGVFSAAHCFLAGAPGLFLMGLILQWMYSKTRNLASCIALHSLCNAVAIIGAAAAKAAS